MDPIEIGIRLHVPLMQKLSGYIGDEKELVAIGRMIDCLLASCQVHAVEKGLDATPEMYREIIAQKLQLIDAVGDIISHVPSAPVDDGGPIGGELICFCQQDGDGECLPCKNIILEGTFAFAQIQSEYLKKIGDLVDFSAPCALCENRYYDTVMSKVFSSIAEAIPQAEGAVAVALLNSFQAMLTKKGIRQMPMLLKAWKDASERKGWK